MPYILFDVAIIVVLALFAWRGASRGLVLSLFGLLAVVVAFAGANFAANLLAPKVGAAIEPKLAAVIEQKLEEQVAAATGSAEAPALPDGEDYPLQDVLGVLKEMGLYEDLISTVDKAVQNGMMDVAASAAAAVAAAIAQSIAYMVLFLIAFILILVAWTLLSHALDLVTRLPGLSFLNKSGGALLGLVKGCILLFVLAWIMRVSGNFIPEAVVQQTRVLKFFMTTNPVTLITGV